MLASGVVRMLLASLSFGLMSALIKVASLGLPSLEIVWGRCLLPLPLLVWLLRRQALLRLPRLWGWLLVRAFCGAGAMVLSFYALGRLQLGDALVLHKLQPVFVALLAPVILAERLSLAAALSVVMSLLGGILVLQPSLHVGSWAGLAMLAAALASAMAALAMRRLSTHEHPLFIVTFFGAFVGLVTTPVALSRWVTPAPWDLVALLGIAAFATAGQLLATGAYARDAAPTIAAAGYAEIVVGALIGYLVFGEVPAWPSVGGGLLILVGAAILVVCRRQEAPSVYAGRAAGGRPST